MEKDKPVTVVTTDTGSTIGIMSRESAERLVAEDPIHFTIRENPDAALLQTLGAIGATHLLVHTVAAGDRRARTPEQAAAFEANKQKAAKKMKDETPKNPAREVSAQRDLSPPPRPRPLLLQTLSGYDAFARDGLKFLVYQHLRNDHFDKIFGSLYIGSWASENSPADMSYRFTAKNVRAANHIADTLRGLGYANATPKKGACQDAVVDYFPSTSSAPI